MKIFGETRNYEWNIYVWGNDFLKKHPRFIIGIDFAL